MVKDCDFYDWLVDLLVCVVLFVGCVWWWVKVCIVLQKFVGDWVRSLCIVIGVVGVDENGLC